MWAKSARFSIVAPRVEPTKPSHVLSGQYSIDIVPRDLISRSLPAKSNSDIIGAFSEVVVRFWLQPQSVRKRQTDAICLIASFSPCLRVSVSPWLRHL